MTDPESRAIRLVLDSSAIAAYTRGSGAVGELLQEVDDEHGAVIVPLTCLLEAAHNVGELGQDYLQILLGLPTVFLLVDDAADWQSLVAMRKLVERHDVASAAMFAVDCKVWVLTRDAAWYAQVDDGRRALQIEER